MKNKQSYSFSNKKGYSLLNNVTVIKTFFKTVSNKNIQNTLYLL